MLPSEQLQHIMLRCRGGSGATSEPLEAIILFQDGLQHLSLAMRFGDPTQIN